MEAKKCDRCGMFYSQYEPNGDQYYSNMLIFGEDDLTASYYDRRVFDLCPSCMRDAVKFMQEKLPPIKE